MELPSTAGEGMKFLYFVRHGESAANRRREFANRGQGPELTEIGCRQAAMTASRLAGNGIKHIYSSPLRRARQSADIIAEILNIDVTETEALREYDVGNFEGTTDPSHWDQYLRTEDDWLLRQLWDRRNGDDGESYTDIERRFTPFISTVCRQESPGAVLLVGHGGLFRMMLPRVLTNVSYSFSHAHVLGHGSCAAATFNNRELSCVEWDGSPFPLRDNDFHAQ
jgi:probable phosphoglycerate mutase